MLATVAQGPRLSRDDNFFTLDFIFYMQNQFSKAFAYFLGRAIKSLDSWAGQVGAMEMSTTLSTKLVDRLTKR